MSGAGILIVSTYVAAIISCYEEGSKVLSAMQDKQKADLAESLALGPPIIQAQYDSHLRRFGDAYALGDRIAREEMKDVLMVLQMTFLANLRVEGSTHLVRGFAEQSSNRNHEVDFDFAALQVIADDTRVRMVMALCQLYQRLATFSGQASRDRMVLPIEDEKESSKSGFSLRSAIFGRKSRSIRCNERSSEKQQYPSSHRTSSSCSSVRRGGASLTIPLHTALPSEENNYAGFCKGAGKLQLGVKKAFSICSRPTGMYTYEWFWRCSKCSFEGPLQRSPGRSSSSSVLYTFNTEVRVHEATGIQYRWAFLAKSHVAIKTVFTGTETDHMQGAFGCLFCCVERRSATPVFGNLNAFMHHLAAHREGSISGVTETIHDRIRCVSRRVAAKSENFDVNIPPGIAERGVI
ncbi:hypothetical protein ASPZODRAFT_236170 [Penicilliopsis zonata CBS 506.65]|uniref:Uncharacterized protein n=1 Tax=Penicilliopsis zonata CBS 506.65 TaxID=1073090 RepID=A0A1L9SU30_9EURO|nr:hypothetical protein ASPZODRAFT_236170 [Penicilliopsis zonata CBS 506.65]OJJ50699.1 hypothetical protein ASPZODRAFT_236170 [Penicilliopsis zonata CBS 506.65]